MSETSLAMMPWFPRDFIAATRAMRLVERGAYRELLDYQWEMGKLPAEHDRLARLLGVSLDEFEDLWPAIKDKFVLNGTGLYNKRLEEHRKKALEQREKKRGAAARTNAKRYGARAECATLSDPDSESHSDTLSASPPSPSPSPSPTVEDVEERSTRYRASKRCPPTFVVTEQLRAWAAEKFPNVDVDAQTEAFMDHEFRTAKRDWEAAWRGWIRRAPEFNGASKGAGETRRKTRYEQAMEALERGS